MEKLLSIVLPTSNRGAVLRESLPLLFDQVKRHSDEVELIVCDNASSDDTVAILNEMRVRHPVFDIVEYAEREDDVGMSIARAAENGTGEFIHFWSDDDVPSPFMVDAVLNALHDYSDIGCVMLNRMQGCSEKGQLMPFLPIYGIRVLNTKYSCEVTLYDAVEEFIDAHARNFGFIGNFVIRRSAWVRGTEYSSKEHLGYQFQAPLLCGLKGCRCVYLGFPHLIQREISPQYLVNWPLYLYVGYARVCKTMEKAGVISNWRKVYNKYRFIGLDADVFRNVTRICIPNKDLYLPYVDEMIKNQPSRISKAMISLIRAPEWFVPVAKFAFWVLLSSALGRFLRKVANKVIHAHLCLVI